MRAGYPFTNVRKGSALAFGGLTPAATKEGRDRAYVVSRCTPSVVDSFLYIAILAK